MAIYQITLRSQYVGQQCVNIFHYISKGEIGETPSALELLTKLGFIPAGSPPVVDPDSLFGHIVADAVTPVSFLEVECANLYSDSDFYVAPYDPAIPGGSAGEGMAPFISYGFFSNRVTRAIRRGYKRFVGVPETAVGPGGIIVDTFLAALAVTATLLSASVSGSLVTVYDPAVLHYDKYVSPKGNPAYKPFPTEAEQLANAAHPVTYAPYTAVRSQVSRQYGKGQ